MKPNRLRINLVFGLLIVIPFLLSAQEEVTYSPNIYAKVDSVFPSNEVIQIANFDDFDAEPGDIVMIYQVKGAMHRPPGFIDIKPISEYVTYAENAGRYEFFIIADIDIAQKLITTTRPLLHDYDNGEFIQLIKSSFYFGDAVVNNNIQVEPWDPVKGIGGVFPIIVYDKLTINAKIDADAAGFRGGSLDVDGFARSCNNEGELFYTDADKSKAANKGEGHVTHRFIWTRGPGYIGNGGGGGVGKYSGGAGGGNWGKGGQSGGQVEECSSTFDDNGGEIDGKGINFYNSDSADASNRIIFGGGGGAGIGENLAPSKPWATGGASGGGIVIVLCDTLESNSGIISSKGGDVIGVADAGAGGGGAGGTILIDARSLIGDLEINVAGGNGGEVDNPSFCPGPGGGGGGGVLWHSWNTIPSNIQLEAEGGIEGSQPQTCLLNNGWPGEPGSSLNKLRAPLNGFYFNKIRGDDEICGGQRPDTIRGTVPKGGNGDFDFKWEYSNDSVSWSEYPANPADSIDFQPNVLYDTTYFRRLVTYNAITDTSLPVRIDVWPIIQDNISEINSQTICELDFGEVIKANKPRGGDDNFTFHWEKSINLTNWEVIGQDTTFISVDPGQLDTTTYYRRYIESVVVCQDYSDTVRITVQPGLKNYGILEDIQSCQGFDADTLTGISGISGGNNLNFYYTWQIKGEVGGWSDFGNDSTVSYLLPGILNDTSFFRRITRSGKCIDTSEYITIEVLTPLGNNIVFGDDKICYGESGLEITNNGSVTGGNFVDYDYYWEIGLNENDWGINESQTGTSYLPGQLFDTTLVRRIVNSSACWDTSDYVTIQVVPEIINQLISPDTTICQAFYPDFFNENEPTGGNGTYTYQWEQKQDGGWQNVDGTGTDYFYQSPGLFDTTLYRRIVYSDICNRASDTILITVLPSISNNLIDEAPLTYTCYEIPKLLAASGPVGGDNSYLYQWEHSVTTLDWDTIPNNIGKDFLTPQLQDSIYYRRIVFSGNYKQCKDTSDYVLVRIHSLPIGNLASIDTTVCDGDNVPFNYALTGKSPWDIHFSDVTSYMVDDANSFILKNFTGSDVTSQHNISFDSIRDANNCKATDLSGMVKVTSYEVPSPKIVSAESVCGDSSVVTAESPKFPAYWYGDNLSFVDSANVISEVRASVYDIPLSIIWKEENIFCPNSDTAEIVFFKLPALETNFDEVQVYNKFHLELETPEPEYDSVSWIAVDDAFSIANSTNTTANLVNLNQFNTDYQLVYRIDNGKCLVTDTLGIRVLEIFRPNVFTPNGDGVNDYFYIEGLEEEGTCKLTIINLWGNVVFQSENTYDQTSEQPFWDGRDEKDRALPDGTYYYILETGVSNNIKKGYVIIKGSGVNAN